MERILITGGSGLIGHHLLNQLSENRYEVYYIGRSVKNINRSVKHLDIDLSKDWDVNLLPKHIDYIIHLAQSENFRLFPEKAIDVFNVNTLSTMKLADYARKSGVKNFIYASSAGIYGNSEDGFNEEQEIVYKNELGFYLASKHCSEVILENYFSIFNVIMLRFFFVYGEGQKEDMLIPRLVNFVKNGVPITLQGTDGIKINPTYVGDAVEAILASMKLDASHKINVAGPQILSLRDIGETIGKACGVIPQFKIEEKEAKNLIGDISKMKKLLHTPQTTFAEGIKSII